MSPNSSKVLILITALLLSSSGFIGIHFFFLPSSFFFIFLISSWSGALMGGLFALYPFSLLIHLYLQGTVPLYALPSFFFFSLFMVKLTPRIKQGFWDKGIYESFLENLPLGFGRSTKGGKIIFVNNALVEMLGYSSKEELMKAGSLMTYVYLEDRQKILQVLAEKGSVKDLEVQLKKKDGDRIWVSLTECSYLDPKDRQIYYDYSLKDMTERKKAQEQLAENLSLLKATLEATNNGILVVDLKGQVLIYNESFIKMWRIPKELLTEDDEGLLQYVEDQLLDPKGFRDKVGSIYGDPKKKTLDQLEFKDGRIFERYSHPQLIHGEIVGRVWSFRDITKEKESLEKVRQGEKELETILNGIQDQVMYLDTDYVIQWANKEAHNDSIYQGVLVGNRCYGLWDREEPCKDCPVQRTLETREDHYSIVDTFDGRSWNLRSYPLKDEYGSLKGIIKIADDITDRIATKKALAESEVRYRSLFDHMFHGFSYCKIVKEKGEVVDYQYLDVNKAFSDTVGLPKEEIRGKRATEIYPTMKDLSFDWIKLYGEVAMTGESITFESFFEIYKRWYRVHVFSYIKDYFGLLFHDITPLKENELELEETKNRLLVTLESIGDGVISTDKEGIIQFINKRAQELTGWEAHEAKGRPLHKVFCIVNERTGDKVENPVEKVLKTGQIEGLANSTLLIDRDGHGRIISDSAAPIISSSGELHGVVMVFRDISKIREGEKRLLESEARYRAIAEHAFDLIALVDKHGSFKYLNPVLKEILGFEPHELEGTLLSHLIHPHDRDLAVNLLNLHQGDTKKRAVLRIRREEGEYCFIEFRSTFFLKEGQFLLTGRDITSWKEAQETLQISAEKYRRTFDNTGTAMVIIESDATISLVNYKTMELLSLPRDEIQGKVFLDFIHPDDRGRILEYHVRRRKDPTIPTHFEVRLLTPKGGVKEVYLIVSYLKQTNQSIGSLLDITPIKKMEEELRNNKGKIEHLHHVAMEMGRVQNEEEICQLMAKAAKDILFFYHSVVSLVEGDQLVVKALSPNTPIDLKKSIHLHEGIMGKTLMEKKSFLTKDIKKCKAAKPKRDDYLSGLSVPIGELGVFQALSNEVDAFDEEDLKLAELLSSHALEGLLRIKSQKEIMFLSFHDPLTGLYNRSFFHEELLRLSKGRQFPLSLIIGDINGLKLVNDAFGQKVGDQLLKKVAEILTNSCRQEDVIARWGGDEFIILLPKTGADVAASICNRIKGRCSEEEGLPVPISITLGTATKESQGIKTYELIQGAEDRMHKQKLVESKSARSSILNTLLKTLKEKSNETEEHALRLQSFAIELGKRINLSDYELDRLSLLVTLHDIGKILIPQKILEKKGQLTKEEWEIIKSHSEIGYRIAISSEDFAHVAEDILAHHEWWDGSGYPKGLKGSDIPLNARIASIVDAYDVMTNDRPYKKKKSKEESMAELRRFSGTQFDPELVPIFLSFLGEE